MRTLAKVSLGFLAALVAVGALAVCAPTPTPEKIVVKETVPVKETEQVVVTATPAPKGGKITYGLTLVVSAIDPHQGLSSELGIFLTSVYDPLVWQTQEGEFVPGLAERWEVSPDGRVYTFYLRKGVKFHDGTPFNAEAVKFSFDRIVDPDLKSQKAINMLGAYDHTEVVDEYTARVYLKEPYAPFLDSVSQVYLAMVSPMAVQKWGADYRDHQVGTGPFMIKEYVAKDHITLVKNPDYNWAPEFMEHQGPAYLDEITFRFYPDVATRAPALEAGEADVMGEVPPQDATRLQASGRFVLLPTRIPGQSLQFFLNTQKFPTDDVRVRQAMLYAVDREAIVNAVFRGFSPVAWGPLSAATPFYSKAVEGMYAYDLSKAKALLAEAGFRDTNGDGIVEKDGRPAEVEMLLMSWGNVPEVGQMIQAMLRQIGINAKTQVLTYPAAVQAAREGQHNMIPQAVSASDPDILRTFFHSRNIAAGLNWSKFGDADMDQWLDDAVRTNDPVQRAQLYEKVQKKIMDEALIIPIRDYVNLNVASVRVKGLRYSLQGWFPWLYDVYVEP
ncbi:MAG: ABC transporter substrate-binding protein [Chloroflexi bacterium]|nr:ABC transporter substrate-binding protein [Chloroflexota bacterium]